MHYSLGQPFHSTLAEAMAGGHERRGADMMMGRAGRVGVGGGLVVRTSLSLAAPFLHRGRSCPAVSSTVQPHQRSKPGRATAFSPGRHRAMHGTLATRHTR